LQVDMIAQYAFRFVIGGVVVSAFAVLGDIFRPKTFAGLFGAAPSIAIATLGITASAEGSRYAAIEARSMMIGAAGLCLYSVAVCHLLKRSRLHALAGTVVALTVWLAGSFGLKWLLLG
jgi:hypothetical protein